eukprot:7093069-Alexandrium_andersonii.AAC.1
MSASLVGSEMCIRDRWSAFSRWPAAPRRWWPPGSASRNDPWRRRLLPVSYTHLTLPTICSV